MFGEVVRKTAWWETSRLCGPAKSAVSGAQDPAVLLQVFDLAIREAAAGAGVEDPVPAVD